MSVFSKISLSLPLKLFCLIPCLASPLSANAESILDWPSVDGFDIKQSKQRFIEAFEDNPDNLEHLSQGFQTCSIDSDKLARLSNVNVEAMSSIFDENKNTKVKVILDIKTLTISSSPEGCKALKSTTLERIPGVKYKHYRVSSDFKYSFLIFVDYQSQMEIVNTINDKEYETHTESDNKVSSFFLSPEASINQQYPKTVYNITRVHSSDLDIISHTLYLLPNHPSSDRFNSVALSRSYQADKITNSVITTGKNQERKDHIQIIGNHTYMNMLDGKMDGLMITDNYLYANDKSQKKYSTACYQASKRINVFKKTNRSCFPVNDEQIGRADVYVDEIYKIGLDANLKLAATSADNLRINQAEQGVNIAIANLADINEERQKKADAAFKNQQDEAKCSLNNQNWAYLGDNCLDGLADGEGSSVDKQGLKFIGSFKTGNRVTGDIHQDGEMIFSGDFKQDKPDGGAICMFEGEYEECRFFRGKRIDTLYKIRKENAKNLAEMKQIQAQQEPNQESISQDQNRNNNGQSNIVVEAIKKEGTKRAASFIFDQLF